MRLVTRSDFDGLVCGVLLGALGLLDEYKFVHPKDLQDGIIEIGPDDILANVPYVHGCGMWFDHHSSEQERLKGVEFTGISKRLPSCARVIWEYYGGHEKFSPQLDSLLEAVDKVDSGMLTKEEINNPTGWILLGFIMDPRTGLGRYRDYRCSNYSLMMGLISYCSTMDAEAILALEDVKERTFRYFSQEQQFREMIVQRSKLFKNVLVLDLREQEEVFTGNRFTAYGMYPDCNVSIRVMWGFKRQNIVFTVGHSVLNRSCTSDIGSLMLKFGGGGHSRVGTCQVATEDADTALETLIEALREK